MRGPVRTEASLAAIARPTADASPTPEAPVATGTNGVSGVG